MTIDTRAKQFEKNFERGFQRARFWTLDDESRAEKIFWRWCHFARFFPCRGEWLNVQREFRLGKKTCSGVSKIPDFRHVDREGQIKGALPL